jgi:hypothetical protein
MSTTAQAATRFAAVARGQAGAPDVTHHLERKPQANDGDNLAPEGPAAGASLPVAAAFGVDPGAAEPNYERDAPYEDRRVDYLVQPEVNETVPPVRASQAEPLDGWPGSYSGDDHGQDDGQEVPEPSQRQEASPLPVAADQADQDSSRPAR